MGKENNNSTILEAASETGRVGRPRTFPEGALEGTLSRRQAQERAFARIAEERIESEMGSLSVSVGAQLGRIEDHDMFRRAVSWLRSEGCYESAKVAAMKLRQWRTGQVPKPRSPYVSLDRAAFEYLAKHQGEHDLVLHSLDLLKEAVRRDRRAR